MRLGSWAQLSPQWGLNPKSLKTKYPFHTARCLLKPVNLLEKESAVFLRISQKFRKNSIFRIAPPDNQFINRIADVNLRIPDSDLRLLQRGDGALCDNGWKPLTIITKSSILEYSSPISASKILIIIGTSGNQLSFIQIGVLWHMAEEVRYESSKMLD